MKAHFTVFALSAILIASIGMSPAFGQIDIPIVVTTDKAAYGQGDTILVSGEVRDLLSGVPISLQVIAANGNLVTIQQLDVGSDKKFSSELTTGGPLWKSEGTYTIKVLYGSQSRTAEVTFDFGGSPTTGPSTPSTPSGPSIEVPGSGFSVSYSITGGSILSIEADVDANSLIITISATDDGELKITLPRGIIDSKILDSAEDDEFFVLVDGEEVPDFEEIATPTDRTLTIQFQAGSEEIEIIGTMVVPEFGTIAALILAVAIISIVVVSARSRLSIIPRY